MKNITLSWKDRAGEDEYKFTQEIVIHQYTNGVIIINCPGAGGRINGYNNKYVTLADYMVQGGLGAVVRMSDPYNAFGWDRKLRQVMSYVLEKSTEICGSSNPQIFLMGASAGASAISLIAWEYPEVKKLLFLEPAVMSNKILIEECLSKYTGELVVVTGSTGNALGALVGNFFIESCTIAKRKEIFTLENCDHNFKGEKNGRIFSQAPFYAFSDIPPKSFPDYRAGVVLYEN